MTDGGTPNDRDDETSVVTTRRMVLGTLGLGLGGGWLLNDYLSDDENSRDPIPTGTMTTTSTQSPTETTRAPTTTETRRETTTTEEPTTTEDEETTTEDEETTTEEVHDVVYVTAENVYPAGSHFNRAAGREYGELAGQSVFAPYLEYSYATGEFLFGALESLDVDADGTAATLRFREDLQWDNGDDWTTEDFDIQLRLAQKTGESIWEYLDWYTVVDERTVRLQFSEPTNHRVLKFDLLEFAADTYRDTHRRFLDEPAEAFEQWEWNDPVASGMWSFEGKGSQSFLFSRNEHFYNAGNVNFSTFRITNLGASTMRQQALMGGQEIDGTTALYSPPEIVAEYPDHVEEIQIPTKWGYGIAFDHDHRHFGRRAVRQAIAHVVDRHALVENAGPRTKEPTPIPCGIPPGDQEYWLGEWYDDFETYSPAASDTDTAAAVLREAGYERVDGTWQDSEGDPVEDEYVTPSGWSDWTTMTETVLSQLQAFGFDITMRSENTGDWFQGFSQGDSGIQAMYWLGGDARSSFPHYSLRFQLVGEESLADNYRERATTEQTVPGRSGEQMTLDTPLETVEQIARQPSDDGALALAQRAAWHNHVDLPMLGLTVRLDQSWTTTDEWSVAEEGDPNRLVEWPQFWQIHEGDLRYTGS